MLSDYKNSNYISIEIITDSLKYIYEFDTNGTQLKDTLAKYHLPFDDINKIPFDKIFFTR